MWRSALIRRRFIRVFFYVINLPARSKTEAYLINIFLFSFFFIFFNITLGGTDDGVCEHIILYIRTYIQVRWTLGWMGILPAAYTSRWRMSAMAFLSRCRCNDTCVMFVKCEIKPLREYSVIVSDTTDDLQSREFRRIRMIYVCRTRVYLIRAGYVYTPALGIIVL